MKKNISFPPHKMKKIYSGAKVQHFFDICKFFAPKFASIEKKQ